MDMNKAILVLRFGEKKMREQEIIENKREREVNNFCEIQYEDRDTFG